MSLDRLFKSDQRSTISPVIDLNKFLIEAASRENSLQNFFQVQLPENNNQDGDPGGSIPQIIQDSRDVFRHFLVQRAQTIEEANETINNGDEVLAKMLGDFPIGEYEITFPPKDSNLMVHKVLHNIRERYKTSAIKNGIVGRAKYFKYRDQELKKYYSVQGVNSDKDIVLTVHLIKPMNRTPESTENLDFKHRCEVKMQIRGDMSLVKFRQKIFCAADFWTNKQDFEVLSRNTYTDCFFNTKFPSNFLFIHDTFYLDLREPNSINISESICEFMKRKQKDFGNFYTKDMANIRVIDLKIRLGQPYVYMHQGCCEHLFIFTDLRLLNPGDVQNIENYPIRLFNNISPKLCSVCNSDVAGYVITESDRIPTCPAFLCVNCFSKFNYDHNGQRIGQFKALHFVNHAGTE